MAAITETRSPVRSLGGVRPGIWLGAMVITSILLRVVVNSLFHAPTILTDELTYASLARQIADDGLSLASGYGVVYPLLMAPSWGIAEFGTTAYALMKATNAVLISLTAIPVFLWARRMTSARGALLAAGLTLLLPAMAYSGHVMTENAFIVAVVTVGWTLARALERPTIGSQALVLAALTLAFATRTQAAVLILAVPIVVLVGNLMEERAAARPTVRGWLGRVARWWPLGAIFGLGFGAIAVRSTLSDWRWSDLLQAYGATADGQYTAMNVARYFLWHLGEATFAVGVIPVAGLAVLVGLGIVNRSGSAAERAFLCTATVVGGLVILQVATFTSYWSERVSERNMLCVFPFAMIAVALWLDRGLPRPRRLGALSAAIAGGLVLCIPFGYLYQRSPITETWALVLPELLTRRVDQGGYDVQVLIVVGTAAALALFGIVRAKAAMIAIPVALAAFFLVTQAAVVQQVDRASQDLRNAPGLAPSPDWIDRSTPAGSEIAFITGSAIGADAERMVLWETQFFNRRSITPIALGAELVIGSEDGAVTRPDGTPATLPGYVVTPPEIILDGETLSSQSGYAIQAPRSPLRARASTAGLYADGWTAPAAAANVYQAEAGSTITVTASRRGAPAQAGSATVAVVAGPLAVDGAGATTIEEAAFSDVVRIGSEEDTVIRFPAPAAPFRIELVFDPAFRWSDYGLADTRDLGGRVSIAIGGEQLR